MALVPLHRGDFEYAEKLCKECLDISRQLGDKWSFAWAIEEIAAVAVLGEKRFERAARLFGSASVLREDIESRRPDSEQALYDRSLKVLREKMAKQSMEKAWNEGKRLNVDQAIHYALTDELT
jgi:hypothetical protein